jgi:serine/threonine protein phosphatase PrpC
LPKFIILGSDGLFDVFKNQEICEYTKTKLKEVHYGARSLMKKAYARKSGDNISVIVIKFIKPVKPKPPKKGKPSFDLTTNNYEWLN